MVSLFSFILAIGFSAYIAFGRVGKKIIQTNPIEIVNLETTKMIEPEVVESTEVKIQKIEDLQYVADCEACKLDIYNLNDGIDKKTIMFFVHGGAWIAGDKSTHVQKGEFFANQGYIFVSINYPLFPEVDYKEQATKVSSAIKWIYDNAKNYNGDKNNIVLMGHSSGGHLLALVSTDTSYLQSVKIKDVILLDSAGLKIPQTMITAPTIFNLMYKPVFGTILRNLRIASPFYHVEENDTLPPFLIFYSTSNNSTGPSAISFDNKLTSNSFKSTLYAVDATHKEINENLGLEGNAITEMILEYLSE